MLALRLTGPVAEVEPGFLSVAVDSAQLVGGSWWSPEARVEGGGGETPQPVLDFARPRLRRLAAELAPAYLRLGGSEADRIYYDLGDEPGPPPRGYERVLTRAQWDAAADFATALGFELLFTLNAGPGPRDEANAWTSTNAAALLAYASARDDPVAVWELGNEVHAFPFIHGFGVQVTPEQYARDVRRARGLVDRLDPDARLAGPSSAYWPEVGEVPELYAEFMALSGRALDVVTWHYYPQQSRRCPLRVRPASEDLMRSSAALDEVVAWASLVESVRDTHAPSTPVWLGETGNAQCGGEPGVSDRYASGFWWLDQLGLLARRGQPVVVRQSLTGASYGLLEEPSLDPRPDYFLSVLFKRLMGTVVFRVEVEGDRGLRAYAHCALAGRGALTLLLLNLDAERGAFARLEGLASERARAFRLTALDEGRRVALNGRALGADADGEIPPLDGVEERLDPSAPEVWVPATSFAFFVLDDARHPACPGG